MRKPTALVLVILLAGLGMLLATAHQALGPLAQDAETAREMTALLSQRGDIVEGSKVRALRVPGSPRRLAHDGVGLLVQVDPAPAVVVRPGALGRLALRLAEDGLERYPLHLLHWVEVVFHVDGAEVRTLVRRGPDGTLTGPDPVPGRG